MSVTSLLSRPRRWLPGATAALAGTLLVAGPSAAGPVAGGQSSPGDSITWERRTSPGQVTLEVRPAWDGERLVFTVAANTHSVDLARMRLSRQITLTVGDRSLEPDSAGTLVGHHGRTTVEFRLRERPESFTLVIRDVPDVPVRRLGWGAAEGATDATTSRRLVAIGGIAPGGLALVDPDAFRVVRLVEGLGAVHGAGISADGRRAFALNMADSATAVTVIDAETGAADRIVALPGPGHHAAADPVRDRLYVAYGTMGVDDGTPSGVAAVDPGTGDVQTRPLDGTPFYVAVAPRGMMLYVSVVGTDRIVALGLPDLEPRGEVVLSGPPSHMDLSSDGRFLYVALTEGRVAKVATGSLEVVAEAETAPDAHAVALAGDPGRLFVANRGSGTITVLDPASLDVETELRLVELPIHLLESPTGTLLVSAGAARELVEIAPDALGVLRRLSLPFQPHQSAGSR